MKKIRIFSKKVFFKRVLPISVAVGVVTGVALTVMADEFGFEWDKEHQEQAWGVMGTTDWGEVPGLSFAEDGSYAAFHDDSWFMDFAGDYEQTVMSVLKDKETPDGMYESKCYVPLVMAILREIRHDGTDADVSEMYYMPDKKMYEWLNVTDGGIPRYTKEQQKESILYIYKKLIACEKAYYQKYDTANIYKTDARLKCILQSVIYGTGYLQEHEKYSQSSAKEYYKKHKLEWEDNMKEFADGVLDYYMAFPAVDHHTRT